MSYTGVAHCCVFYLPLRLPYAHIFNLPLFQGGCQGGCFWLTFSPLAYTRVLHPSLSYKLYVLLYRSTSFTSIPTQCSTAPSDLMAVFILKVCKQISVTSFPSVTLLSNPFCSGRWITLNANMLHYTVKIGEDERRAFLYWHGLTVQTLHF